MLIFHHFVSVIRKYLLFELQNITPLKDVNCNIMKNETDIIISTKPSIWIILFGILGTLLFGAFALLMWTSEWKMADDTDYKTGMIIYWSILSLFILFSLGCLSMILGLKTIVLTEDELIIKRPLLMIKRIIPLCNISNIKEVEDNITSSNLSSSINIYNGHKTVIELNDGKKISYTSIEISDYDQLKRKLYRVTRNTNYKNKNESNKFEGLGWIIFITILLIGFIYEIVKKN